MVSTKITHSSNTPHADDLLQRAHRTFVGFFQGYFESQPKGAFCWSPNDEETEIYISGEKKLPRGRKVAAVHVALGVAGWAGMSLDSTSNADVMTGAYTFDDQVNTTVVISCLGLNEVSARYLGWLCFRGLAAHKRIIQAKGTVKAIHNTFQLSTVISADRIDKAYEGMQAVQIVLPFTVQCRVELSAANDDYRARLDKIVTRMEQV